MSTQESLLKPSVHSFCQELETEFNQISSERKERLSKLSGYISGKVGEGQVPKVIVICTHNSRRSHIGQLWLAVGADYFQTSEIQTFSGGTEATAFHPNAVKALRRTGFEISVDGNTENPVYTVNWKEEGSLYPAFSKKYEEDPNPKEKFAAVMVCSEADEGCPFVVGCDFRLALPFEDPKDFDGTEAETSGYETRVREIGREMLFVMSLVKG